MNSFIVFSALGSVLALVFAVLMGKRALSADEGTDQMRKIALRNADLCAQGGQILRQRVDELVLILVGQRPLVKSSHAKHLLSLLYHT